MPDFYLFLTHLFARKEFTATLLERSFNRPIGWVEFAVALTLMALTFWVVKVLVHHGRTEAQDEQETRHHFFVHLWHRLAWPLLLFVCAIAATYAWQALKLGYRPLWLHLLVLATPWMMVIRTVMAILHYSLPNNRFTGTAERFLSAAVWVVFFLWLSGLDDVLLNWMNSVVLPLGKAKITLWTIVSAIFWLGVVLLGSMWVASLLESRLMQMNNMDLSLRIVLTKIIKTALVLLSILVALPMVGIDLTMLSVFGGALGVGLGFGLQKIASNYVSGFIILLDRSIRVGDRLVLNNFTGYVTKITSRFVVMRSTSGAEALVPNETFVSQMVINESYTGKALWQSLSVQVAYDTDLNLALQLMQEAATKQERVAKDPGASAFLVGFADSGVNLTVGFWVEDPENGFLGLNSAILMDIWQQFREADINFPFPQREVRILKEAPDLDEVPQQKVATGKAATTSNEPGVPSQTDGADH